MLEDVTIGDCRLILGDCREVLPLLPPVDLVLTDPPYGQSVRFHHGRTGAERYIGIKGDDCQTAGIDVLAWAELKRLPVLAFASPYLLWPGEWSQYLVWDKGPALGGGGDVKKTWKYTFEMVQVARLPALVGGRDSAVLRFWDSPSLWREHMTQKPETLISYLISKTSHVGTVILDPFLGSGTTGACAAKMGRRFIGCEIDPHHFKTACRRIEQAYAQPRLFEDAKVIAPEQGDIFHSRIA